jgi:hypothetical protein
MTYLYVNSETEDLFNDTYFKDFVSANFRREMNHLITDIRLRIKVDSLDTVVAQSPAAAFRVSSNTRSHLTSWWPALTCFIQMKAPVIFVCAII